MSNVGVSVLTASFALLLQMLVLNRLDLTGAICNLPLTITINWGLVFGSPLPPITTHDLRTSSLKDIFTRQILNGSPSGFLLGLLFACLYSSVIPVFPVYFPIVGWTAGYFCLRSVSQGNLLSIPLVFVLTVVSEALMAWELFLLGRHDVFAHMQTVILPEALLNALIAPFIYFPMRSWYDWTVRLANSPDADR